MSRQTFKWNPARYEKFPHEPGFNVDRMLEFYFGVSNIKLLSAIEDADSAAGSRHLASIRRFVLHPNGEVELEMWIDPDSSGYSEYDEYT